MDRGNALARFAYEVPSFDSYWRAVVLFGQNVQSYKFALAGALLEIGGGSEAVSLDELAVPYASRVAQHLRAPTSREPPNRAVSSMRAGPTTGANSTTKVCGQQLCRSASTT